jgi:hypothetical protein
MRTFSLLPTQLVPYCRYTLASMAFGVLLADASQDSLFTTAEKRLDPDSRTTGFLLVHWLTLMRGGLNRAHPWLADEFDLSRFVRLELTPVRDECSRYLAFILPRSPPDGSVAMWKVADKYSHATNQFFLGTPSQDRMGQGTC